MTRRKLTFEGIARTVGVPLGLWIVTAGAVFATCALSGRSPFRTTTWDEGDPAIYLDIARHGYNLAHCNPGGSAWCGNAGWFPAYPALIRLISEFGLSEAPVALALAWVFVLGTLVLLWSTFLERRLGFTAAIVLIYAAFVPGQAWGYGMYPVSMLAFCLVGYLWFLSRERWLAAGVVGAVLVLTHPIGVAAPAAAGLWLVVDYRELSWRERFRRITLAVSPSILAIGAFFLLQQATVGRWNAYFLVQAKYEHGLRDPLIPTFHAVGIVFEPGRFSLLNMGNVWQTLLVIVVLTCVVVDLALRRRERARWELLIVVWAVATWWIPEGQTHIADSRELTALLPLALLVGLLPRLLAGAVVVASVALSIPLELAFLRSLIG